MRKMLFIVISGVLSSGCLVPYFRYEVKEPGKNGAVKHTLAEGHVLDLPDAIRAASSSERERAEAECIRERGVAACYGWYGAGGMNLPRGYVVAGQALRQTGTMSRQPQQQSLGVGDNSLLAAVVRGQRETNIYLKALTTSQEQFQKVLLKNRKTTKPAKKGKNQ